MTQKEIQDKHGLSTKEAKTTLAYVGGATSQTKAVEAAGYSSPRVENSRVFARPRVQNAILALFREEGITENVLITKANQLLEAKKIAPDGSVSIPDNDVQHRTWRDLLKVFHILEDRETQINIAQGQTVSGELLRSIFKRAEGLKKKE